MPPKPSQPRLRARYDERRDRVIATAAELFADRGYQATSMADLSEAAGLTVGGIYHYIDGKEQLLFAIFSQLMDPLLERVGEIAASGEPPEDQLRALVRAWLAHIAAHRDHMVVFNQERRTLERDPAWKHIRAARREFERLLGGVLERGVQAGAFRTADPQLTLLALLGMANYTAQWFAPRGRLDADQIADGYIDLLLDGIRA